MNFQRGTRKEDPEINMIALIDVLLVILIFLMVTTTYARFSELQINLPQADGDNAKDTPAQIMVNVSAQGVYSVNDAMLGEASVDVITRALSSAAGAEKDPMVVISADASATHQAVVRVMDAARKAGYPRVTFVAESSSAH